MSGFGRSNSLSINTGGGSLFGNNATQGQQQSAGLFGSSTAASTKPATTGGLFGSTSQSQTGGLFGGGAPAASQPPQTASLFGGQQQTSQPQSGSLFGNLNKPAGAAGGLFGSSTAQPQSQPQQSGGLFGGTLGGAQDKNQQATSQSGGLFNPSQPQQKSLFGAPIQQTATPSLFGNTNAQQPQTSTPSMFGATQQAQTQQPNGMLGQNAGFSLGGSTSVPFNGQSVQVGSFDNIKGTTRFSDLHPELQRQIVQVDLQIQERITACNQIRETLPRTGDNVASIAPDVAYIEEYLSTVELGIDNDSASISHLRDLVKKDAEDASLSFRAIINLKLPNQFHYANRTNLNASTTRPNPTPSISDDPNDPSKPVDLMGYFQTRTDDLGHTLDLYQGQIREIEAHLRTMEAGTVEKAQQLTGSRNGPRDQRRELVEALKAIEGAILDSAKKVGQIRDAVTTETLGHVGAALL
ncbi:hypothetical protein K504DRAFT_463328 [Pleomassaria siparia CBS 279.74]|uniref:Nucleoporin NUP49/NSP49 n=1 Tax=Pleomassaria siparia CBS 279.74 TaxID=1314801 RepID=A0A6G1JSR7_9PLEO|nr:hypothetical protein K504DRAFT_463328 [Pleomassaria siparia CBS 279.74]